MRLTVGILRHVSHAFGRVGRARTVRAAVALVGAVTLGLPLAGCTTRQLEGESPAYLIVESLTGANGAEPDELAASVDSDVITMVSTTIDGNDVRVPTFFADPGEVSFALALKDPGTAASPAQPTSANFITVNRYRVDYVRSDGRNTPGVDVPYGFDGGLTVTVTGSGVRASLTLVRIQAKQEAPLAALRNGGPALAISTIARVTFYGEDQAGREVKVTGNIGVNFANWGDPE